MPHIITSLCVREGSCATVCPVECIIPGKPQDEWPLFYIDTSTCIDCGACVSECPFDAIFPEDDVPARFIARGDEVQSMPKGTPGFDLPYDGFDYEGNPVHLDYTRLLVEGEEVDLTRDIQANYDYFQKGPGYRSLTQN
ncbi:MAG TPA: ferredoxin family protein [Brevefilum fermentans]|jgi:ferredoxin|nr:ferredoxin family protein [Brevefilum fermentans]HQA28638.1 ferredoxin family protein [Brevefilum fermentans]